MRPNADDTIELEVSEVEVVADSLNADKSDQTLVPSGPEQEKIANYLALERRGLFHA